MIRTQLDSVYLPKILCQEISKTKAEITFKIPENLFYLKGHFPGFSIMPGVVQLHWAVLYSKAFFKIPDTIHCINQTKFSDLMFPELVVHLILENLVSDCTIAYQYKSDDKRYSSGRFIYSGF